MWLISTGPMAWGLRLAAKREQEETDAAEAGKLIADEVREALAARRQQVCKRRLRA